MAIIANMRRRVGRLVGDGQSLRGRMVRSASWLTAGYGVEMFLRLGSSLFLTRLLSPEAFGIMATAQVFLYTAVMLSDVGIRSLVITHEEADDPDFLRAVWTFQFIRGIAVAIIVAIFGFLLGLFQQNGLLSAENSFAEPMLPAMIAVLGITLAIGGLRSSNEHIMARDLRQDILVKLETGTKILSTIITVAAVWITHSVWGFVYAALIVVCIRTMLSFRMVPGPKMRLLWHRGHIGYMISRGKWIGLSSWTTLIGSLADKILIGGYFGAHTLGLYSLALSLADALHSLMTQVSNAVSLSTIRELIARPVSDFRRKFSWLRNVTQLTSTTVGLAVSLSAPFIIDVMYDNRYAATGVFLSLLALKYLIFHFSLNLSVLDARREFAIKASFNAIRTSVFWVAAFYFATEGWLYALITAIALSQIIERILASSWLVRRGVLSKWNELKSYALTFVILASAKVSLFFMSRFDIT